MMGFGRAAGLACCAWLGLAAAQPAAAWTVTVFDRSGASDTQLWGINDAGQFVGSDSLGGYLVSAGAVTALSGPAGAIRVTPFAVSDSGLVVGSWWAGDGSEHGFLLQDGLYASFDVASPAAVRTEVRHVSLDGRWLTGFAVDANGLQTGFVFDRGTAALQTVATDGTVTLLQGVNGNGLAVGSQLPGGGLVFDAHSGSLQLVTAVDGAGGVPRLRDINDAGLVTGFASQQAIVGTLGGSFTVLTVAGATASFGEGLNNAGQVVGSFTDANGISHGFIASSVPEPASAAFLLAGLGLLGAARLRRGPTSFQPTTP